MEKFNKTTEGRTNIFLEGVGMKNIEKIVCRAKKDKINCLQTRDTKK